MPKTNEQDTDVREHTGDRFSADLESLHESFAQLREDVTTLLDNALGTAKSGASAVKDRGTESVEHLGDTISEQPLLSAAIALGIGFVIAKMMTRH